MSKGQEKGLVDVALMAKREKKREEWRKEVQNRKTPKSVRNSKKHEANERASSSAPCFVCQKRIRFDIEAFSGKLVRYNLDGSRHVHQNG